MLEFTQGELGWDVFVLEYKVDAPLDTVLDPKSMESYLKMFKHLWQIKRVEYSLSDVWRRLMTNARTFRKFPGPSLSLSCLEPHADGASTELSFQFHQTRIALAEMIFFIRQLQYYCHLEVIACSWQVLEDFAVKKEGDLDSLIEAHRAYLHRLVTKALLISPRRSSKRGGNEVSGLRGGRGRGLIVLGLQPAISMLEQVRKIFKILLQYREAAVRPSIPRASLVRADSFFVGLALQLCSGRGSSPSERPGRGSGASFLSSVLEPR